MEDLTPEHYRKVVPTEQLNAESTRTRLQGKVAIVTGGACGIGRATVERLSNDGATVAIFDIDELFGHDLVEQLRSVGRRVTFHRVDTSQKDQCARAADAVAKENGGKINYLVNGAAYFGAKALDAKQNDWERTLNVNVVGYSNMVQACHSYMKSDSEWNSIVNISSISGHRSQPHRWTYSAAKGAVNIMTKCMALDLSKDRIRVNSVSPAWVWTREQWRICKDDRASLEAVAGQFHMNRKFVETGGVASAIAFLCSDDAKYINGIDMPVDSGYQAMGPEGLGEHSLFAADQTGYDEKY